MRRIAASLILFCALAGIAFLSLQKMPAVSATADSTPASDSSATPGDLKLPLLSKSTRFAVIGDSGTGDHRQYQVAEKMEMYRQRVNYDFVIMLGDNIYGGHRPEDFRKKFEVPYRALLDAGVKFYAALGNHDDPNDERLYKPFNMNGQRYYSFKKGDVEFFALDSTYLDPKQVGWIQDSLQKSNAKWKIAYFHHPLYSDGHMHGPDLDLRAQLTPLFRQYGVNVVFSGHEHVYERVKPADSIYYFILGNSGKLMTHDFRSTERMDKGFDTDQSFMLVEISGDTLYFQTISRSGETIDAGSIRRQTPSISAAQIGAFLALTVPSPGPDSIPPWLSIARRISGSEFHTGSALEAPSKPCSFCR